MMYLPLAEATVITFLAPMLAGYICHVLIKDPFTRTEQLASLVALAGIILIARPLSLFGPAASTTVGVAAPEDHTNSTAIAAIPPEPTSPASGAEATPAQRLLAILVALIGVLGGAAALASIRVIGTRAHPRTSHPRCFAPTEPCRSRSAANRKPMN